MCHSCIAAGGRYTLIGECALNSTLQHLINPPSPSADYSNSESDSESDFYTTTVKTGLDTHKKDLDADSDGKEDEKKAGDIAGESSLAGNE